MNGQGQKPDRKSFVWRIVRWDSFSIRFLSTGAKKQLYLFSELYSSGTQAEKTLFSQKKLENRQEVQKEIEQAVH